MSGCQAGVPRIAAATRASRARPARVLPARGTCVAVASFCATREWTESTYLLILKSVIAKTSLASFLHFFLSPAGIRPPLASPAKQTHCPVGTDPSEPNCGRSWRGDSFRNSLLNKWLWRFGPLCRIGFVWQISSASLRATPRQPAPPVFPSPSPRVWPFPSPLFSLRVFRPPVDDVWCKRTENVPQKPVFCEVSSRPLALGLPLDDISRNGAQNVPQRPGSQQFFLPG